MKRVEKISIKNNADIIYAKTVLRNYLKKRAIDATSSFLIFALMELSTNLLKHAKGGEIWILELKEEILLSALDFGPGIENVAWAMENGTSRLPNSLGIGLYQINKDERYHVEIASFCKKNLHGTIVLVKPKALKVPIVCLNDTYIGELVSGDICAKKGRFLLLVDAAGHGRKAAKSAQVITEYFYNTPFSSLLADEYLEKIHTFLKEKRLRGAAVTIFEILQHKVFAYGIGNISFWHQEDHSYNFVSQKDGILGDFFHVSDKQCFILKPNHNFIAATDGIDATKMNKVLSLIRGGFSPPLIALIAIHFASVAYDDKTVIVMTQGEKDESRI
jgi:hypothetical protein